MYCFEQADWSWSLFITPKCGELLTYSKGSVTRNYKSLITKKKSLLSFESPIQIHNMSSSIISLYINVVERCFKLTCDTIIYN